MFVVCAEIFGARYGMLSVAIGWAIGYPLAFGVLSYLVVKAIDLRMRDSLELAIAEYKHYDLLIVNPMFDGMNLVAKEGPLINERNGVSILSENTGAHEELGEFAISVNPFDIQEQADAIYRALSMPMEERSTRAAGLKAAVTERNPGDWINDQLADISRRRELRAVDA